MNKGIVIYPAAALFNARETYFNSLLVEKLEKLGYKTNFPQRDGFEFGYLKETLKGKLPDDEIYLTVLNVIYFLDLGVFLPSSDVVLANLDEPVDEGVVVESSYAKLMGKFVIGLRTDIRSPYGRVEDLFGGTHFFPVYQSHRYISHYMPSRTSAERESQMDLLISKIHRTIQEAGISRQEEIPDHVLDNPNLKQVLEGAELLFGGVEDIHSSEGMDIIAARYIENKNKLEEIRPIRIS